MRLFNRFMPSVKYGNDPASISPDSACPSLLPAPPLNTKLTKPVTDELNSYRSKPILATRSAGKRLTVIVPYRNRQEHLEAFVPALGAYLRGQGMDFTLTVVEQEPGMPFNRGKLINIGVKESSSGADYLCIHDVDYLPIKADYNYCSHPLRLAHITCKDNKDHSPGKRSTLNPNFFSGVVAVDKEQFLQVNGFSNDYWHWGGEDDDFWLRLMFKGMVPLYDPEGEFRVLWHNPSVYKEINGEQAQGKLRRYCLKKKADKNARLLRKYKRKMIGNESGYGSVEYNVLSREDKEGYTLLRVSV